VRAKEVSIAGILLVITLSCLAASAQVAAGLEPGVQADPGSPAAKEYALPLNQARQTGGGAPGNGASGPAKLFGAGIKPPDSAGSARSRSSAGGAPHGARPGASGVISYDRGAPVPAIVLRAARSQGSSNGGGSILALLGGGVAIIVLGAFGGTLMRRGRQSEPST
jgi:hypothetical protein